MPLQAGTWIANVGGIVTQLQILSVDSPTGSVSGALGGNSAGGFWEEDAQRLTLLVQAPAAPVGQAQPYQTLVGYLFTDTVNLTGVSGTIFFTLTGFIENFMRGGGLVGPTPTARRPFFGWYAQIGVD